MKNRKNLSIVMGLLSLIGSFLGCSRAYGEGFKSVSVAEFEQVISDTAVYLLDVRTAGEFAEGHLVGAVNIDVLQATFEKNALDSLPKNQTVALYCRSGNRSKKAAFLLAKLGYTVIELDSGFMGWQQSGRPIEVVEK